MIENIRIEITDEIADQVVIESLIACKRSKDCWEDCDGLEEAINMVLEFYGYSVLDRQKPE